MSEKTRHKKDGHEANKEQQAMREAVHDRKEEARITPHTREHGDPAEHKSTSAGIKSRQGTA